MFLTQSIGCHAVYFTLMLCVMVDITAMYQSSNAQKRKTFETISALFNVKDDNLSVRPCNDGSKNLKGLYMSSKSQISTENITKKNLVCWEGW